ASAGEDGIVKLWSATAAPDALRVEAGAKAALAVVAFHPDGRQVAAAVNRDRTVRFWDVKTGKEGPVLRGHPEAITDVAISPGGRPRRRPGVGPDHRQASPELARDRGDRPPPGLQPRRCATGPGRLRAADRLGRAPRPRGPHPGPAHGLPGRGLQPRWPASRL